MFVEVKWDETQDIDDVASTVDILFKESVDCKNQRINMVSLHEKKKSIMEDKRKYKAQRH